MKPSTVSKRYAQCRSRAIDSVNNEKSYRAASAISHIPLATLQRAVTSRNQPPMRPPGRSKCLSTNEESLLVSFLSRYSDRGIPLNRVHLAEAVAVSTARMDLRWREKLPFKTGRSGRKFLQSFQRRQKGKYCLNALLDKRP